MSESRPDAPGISFVDDSGLDRRDRGQRSTWSLTCCTASAVSRPMTAARVPGSSAEIASSICWVVRSTVIFVSRNTLAATASNPAAAASKTIRIMFLGTLISVPFRGFRSEPETNEPMVGAVGSRPARTRQLARKPMPRRHLCQRVGGASARCCALAVLAGLPADLLADLLAEILDFVCVFADAERGHDLEHAHDYQPHTDGDRHDNDRVERPPHYHDA